jgi:hypothetical protein
MNYHFLLLRYCVFAVISLFMNPIIKSRILESLNELYYKMETMAVEDIENELEERVCSINPHPYSGMDDETFKDLFHSEYNESAVRLFYGVL